MCGVRWPVPVPVAGAGAEKARENDATETAVRDSVERRAMDVRGCRV